MRALRHPLRFRAVGDHRDDLERQGEPAEPRLDAALGSRLTLACALEAEERAARRGGARSARIGLGAALPLPDGRLAGFGLAGALVDGLEPGTVLTATRVVDESGMVLWEGEPLPVPGARNAVICSSGHVVDDPSERANLAARTGAVAVDMESGALAATGRLSGVVRAVSDTPRHPVGRLAHAATADGRVRWGVVALAFLTQPLRTLRSGLGARRALSNLEHAAGALRTGTA